MARFKSADYDSDDLPEDEWLLLEILDTDDTTSTYEGKEQEQVLVKFEVVEGEYEGSKPRGYFNATFGPKSHLRKLGAAALGVDIDEIEDLDTNELKGKRVYAMGDYGEDGKASYWKPRKFKAAEGSGRRRRRKADDEDGKEDKAKGRERRTSDDEEEKKEDTTRRRRRSEAPDEDERTTRRRATAGTSSKSDSKDDDGDIDF